MYLLEDQRANEPPWEMPDPSASLRTWFFSWYQNVSILDFGTKDDQKWWWQLEL